MMQMMIIDYDADEDDYVKTHSPLFSLFASSSQLSKFITGLVQTFNHQL